ncbi:MAG: hypothetical protein IJT59_03745 [Desulfovibrionaceae bacterium]|nr:hypothetical protein [Desulfovibrionaceae bacterium]
MRSSKVEPFDHLKLIHCDQYFAGQCQAAWKPFGLSGISFTTLQKYLANIIFDSMFLKTLRVKAKTKQF